MVIRSAPMAWFAPLLLVWALQTSAQQDVDANPWKFVVPTRALSVEGGLVAFQVGVRCDLDAKRFHPLFARHPTQYFLVVVNERDAPIWPAVEWRFPDDKPRKFDGMLPGRKFATFWWKAQGVIADKPIPFKIWVHADAGRTQVLVEKETSMSFSGADTEPFLSAVNSAALKSQVSNAKECPVLPGWREMTNLLAPTVGSTADPQLQHDVKLLLWKEQSKQNWDCTHEATGAEEVQPSGSVMLAKMPETLRRSVEQLQAGGQFRIEKWSVRSCDATARYEVGMGKSPTGGTDLIVEKVPDNPTKTPDKQ